MLKNNFLRNNIINKLSNKEIIHKEIMRITNKYHLKNNLISPKKKNKNLNFYISIINRNLKNNYNSSNKTFQEFLIESLIKRKEGHFFAKFRDEEIYNQKQEFLNQFYKKKESKKKIKNYTIYYKNYSEYFCKPIISDFPCNKIMNKHMEIKAEIFYDENYANKSKQYKLKDKGTKEMNIFNKDIIKEIETMKNSKKKQFFFGFNKSFNESSTFENISNIFPYPIKLIKVNDLKISKKSANIDKNDSILNNSINSILYMLTKNPKKEKEKKNMTSLNSPPSTSKNSPMKNSIKFNNPYYLKLKHHILINPINNIYNLSPTINYKKNIFKKKVDSPLSFNETQKLKKTSSKIRKLKPSRKLSFYQRNNNNNTTQNIIKYMNKNDKYQRNNNSPLMVNLKSPMNLYLAQSKLIRSTSNINKYSVRNSKNSHFNSSRNSNALSNNSQNKKLSVKSSLEDNNHLIINRKVIQNYRGNYSNLSLNPSLNKISVDFNSTKNNSKKFGKLIFPNKNFSIRANSNDYNKIKPTISLLKSY